MPRNEKLACPSSPQVIVLEAKRNALFERMQCIYEQAKIAHISEEKRETFINSCITIDNIRSTFHDVLDEYNEKLIIEDPAAKPNYQAYVSFEDLFCFIKQTLSQLTPSKSTCATSMPVKANCKLPPIELMSFDGNIQNWPLFYASFKSTVHDNSSLTNADKLYYLLGKLSAKVQSVFAGVTPCAENYEVIFKSLLDRYQDVRILGSTYLDQILNLKLNNTPSASTYQFIIDKYITSVNSLKNLGIENLTDFILFHIAIRKFDVETIRAFEMHSYDTKLPKLDSFTNFIKTQCRIYENTQPTSTSSNSKLNKPRFVNSNSNKNLNPQSYVSSSMPNIKCSLCNKTHDHFYKCFEFEKLSPSDRFKCIKDNNACINCLSGKHRLNNCTSKSTCRVCAKRHHTLLHFNSPRHTSGRTWNEPLTNSERAGDSRAAPSPSRPLPSAEVTSPNIPCAQQSNLSLCTTTNATVLLATAQVIVYDVWGKQHIVRCLLDSASQSSFMSYDCCNRLGLLNKLKPSYTMVRGIGGSHKTAKGSVDFIIYSRFNLNISFKVSSLIVDRITDTLPSVPVDLTAFSHIKTLPLADSTFASPGTIDILLGSSIFPHLLLPGIVQSSFSNIPPAIQTVFGYVIMGSVPTFYAAACNLNTTSCCSVIHDPMDTLLKRFWELEEITAPPAQSVEDLECEDYFRASTARDESGRYIVALPFCKDVFTLGDSYAAAYRRLLCLERKLDASPKTRTAYNDVMRDYIDKGYLSPVQPRIDTPRPLYYIPHHAVVRDDKTTTKLRVVLDASCKTSSGFSLNDMLHAGSNLQGDLFCILINFRLFKICLSADCRQMFLQIIVREPDRRFQRILYRFSTAESVTEFEFNRVCFGLKSSPFHALRVVRQLIADEGDEFPAAAAVASSALYTDDVAFSVMTDHQAIALSSELIQFFKRAQFDLVKWSSNSDEVLASIPDSHKEISDKSFDNTNQQKILGLHWDRSSDCFHFKVVTPGDECTKRSILSAVARLWDILGFVAPAILYAKLLIKELWLLKCDWDEQPPRYIINAWKHFCTELPSLNGLRIPRHLGIVRDCEVNIVGFADASERAYGGVIYLHVRINDKYHSQLICAKSKVLPVKVLSVARLELCAAVLLSKLISKVVDTIKPHYPISKLYAFSDSKVVLCWIKSSPHRWQTFVANRVVKIIDCISPNSFYHVAGSDNPADCLSRGLTPDKLINHPLWFNGPSWVASDPSDWPLNNFKQKEFDEHIPEQRAHVQVFASNIPNSPLYTMIQRFSSFSKLLRATAYIYKFLKILNRNCKINSNDLSFAENKLIYAVQQVHFTNELTCLKNNEPCSPAFNKLRPFIDSDGLIRVGGRLSNSAEDYTCKHPLILPRNDHFVNILIDYYHKKYLHAGPELLMSLLRQKYWILAARRLIRFRIHQFNVCFKAKPRPTFPLMADLPSHRVNQVTKAFTHVGCDYAGPLQYTPLRGRGIKSRKAWICIFTCLTTRATHIEVCTDLSTVSFLAALKRFLSRRGPVECLYTDNGTCFVGARTYLRDFYSFLSEYRPHLESELSEKRINWKFIPPASPHFGGCWESVVKIVKSHLFKVIGQQILSYEELITVLTQIEALVNSRPLTAMSSDPADPSALTPAHFLNTVPLSYLPAPDAQPADLHQRHSLLDSIVQSFWRRWRIEYLHKLQSRAKWNVPSIPIKEGTVVVIVTDNAPPFSWPLGIVDKVFTSKDGTTRVVNVKTAKGSYLRPVVRLCPLPNQ